MKLIFTSAAIFSILALTACDMTPINAPDQCLRAELFKQCMSILPKGPEHVVNSNDWDEVVNSCESVAYYQSVRAYSAIKQECRNQ